MTTPNPATVEWVPLAASGGPEGPVGPAGTPGDEWIYGTGAPSGGSDRVGTLYLDSANGNVWEKQASGWVFTGVVLKGPQGAQGTQGPQGIKGDTGSTGSQGATGSTGSQGIQGIQGPAGPANPWQMGQTWAILGALSAGALPGIFVPKLASQTVTLKRIRAVILSGTSIVAQCRRNGTNLGSPMTITPAAPTFAFSQVLADADHIDFVLSAPTGSPADLSLTAFLEHLAA